MNNEMIILTMKEQRTNDIMVKLISKEISMNDAIRLTGLSERQLYRKKKGYLKNGINSIPHKSRGKPNGKGYSKKLKDEIVRLYIEEYNGWNFYHFNSKSVRIFITTSTSFKIFIRRSSRSELLSR